SGSSNRSASVPGDSSASQSSTVEESSADDKQDSEASTAEAGEFTTIEEGKLIMATNAQFPPYELVSDGEGFNGTGFEGIDVEIASAIADKLGLELQIDDMEFDSALVAVQNDAADVVLAGLSYSEERDEVLDFTDSYATGVQVVIVKEGSDVTMDNLGEKMIGTQRGTTGYIYASDTPENGGYGEDHVSAYDNGATAVQALVNGQVDAVIIDEAPAKEFVAANEGLTILPGNWVEEQYCAAVNEGNTALLNAINTALNELMDDGTVQEILDKYITAE
ncbi:MAG: ABC transporter substrate-binding protein, partial [Acutalibacter sp.]